MRVLNRVEFDLNYKGKVAHFGFIGKQISSLQYVKHKDYENVIVRFLDGQAIKCIDEKFKPGEDCKVVTFFSRIYNIDEVGNFYLRNVEGYEVWSRIMTSPRFNIAYRCEEFAKANNLSPSDIADIYDVKKGGKQYACVVFYNGNRTVYPNKR